MVRMCGAGGCFPWAGGASGCGIGWMTSPPGGAGCAAWKCGRRGVKCAPGAGKVMVNAKLRMDNWELVKRRSIKRTCVILRADVGIGPYGRDRWGYETWNVAGDQ